MLLQKILNYNYEVLLIDTTYRTNKYKMPLIIISRVMPLNTSYYITFAFISKEIFKICKWLFKYVKNFYKYFDIPDSNVILTNAQKNVI